MAIEYQLTADVCDICFDLLEVNQLRLFGQKHKVVCSFAGLAISSGSDTFHFLVVSAVWFIWLFDGAFKDHDAAQVPAFGCFGIWSGDALHWEPDPEAGGVQSQTR